MLRRDFLHGLFLTGVAVVPGSAAAGSFLWDAEWVAIDRTARALHQNMDRMRDAVLRRSSRRCAPEAARELAAGVGALSVFQDVQQMSIEHQVHPSVQDVLREAGHRLGRALDRVSNALARIASGATYDADVLTLGVGGGHRLLSRWLPGLEGSHPRSRARRLVRCIQQGDFAREASTLVSQLHGLRAQASRSLSGSVQAVPPALERAVENARRRWQNFREGPLRSPDQIKAIVLISLGFLVSGVLLYLGLGLLLGGLFVSVLYLGVGLVVMLLGVAVILGGAFLLKRSIKGLRRVLDENSQSQTPSETAPSALEDPQPDPPDTLFAGEIGATGWQNTATVLEPGVLYQVSVTGQTRAAGADPLSPDGDRMRPGGVDHHLPGAPEGALLGRVQGFAFVIGQHSQLTVPVQGALELVVNGSRLQPREGHLQVSLVTSP